MAPEAILKILQETYPQDVTEVVTEGVHPHAIVKPERWHEIALFLRDDERLDFDWLRCISGVDHIEDKLLTAVYDLHATQEPDNPDGIWTVRNEIAIKVRVDRDDPHIPSVADVWPAANWHEREAYDLLGIVFDGHPDLRRILCCDDWVGHPLRKDYEYPLEFHGIPAVTEYGQSRPQH
jgi:NADH-quinone oxidoreductase subunit C